MPQSAQEFAEITALIKGILNGYPGNSAIFREYLQNSDDARATSQIFILDERSYPADSLVDPALKEAQGPALIAINDGILRDVDWTALRKINSSSKNSDESQTGKNGLGFRASYHLTENPHVLSGQTLMILDPHQAFEVHKGGISIDLIEEGHDYQDQLAPFRFLFEDSKNSFNGTIFRLPLRTQEQATRSQIKDSPTSVDDMRAVLQSFASNDLEEVILFLKHITRITIRHITESGAEKTSISVSIDALPSPCPQSQTRKVTITSAGGTTTRTWQFNHYVVDKATAGRVMEDRLGYSIGDGLAKEKLVPTIDVAIPLDGSPIRGRLFTLLPFPQLTGFPLHLNAVFALTTDRQSLKNIHEVGQPTSRERRLVEWNRTIFDTWTPILWANMLTDLPSNILGSASWTLWPPEERGEGCYWAGLSSALAKLVVSQDLALFPTRTYKNTTLLVAMSEANVLVASPDPGVCLDTLSQLGVSIVQPPRHIFNILSSESFQLSSSILSPQSLHKVLCRIPRGAIEQCDKAKLKAILDYLVFSISHHNPVLITGLPWFDCTSGHSASLELASKTTSRYFIPSSEEEAQVFATHSNMLSWGSFSDKLRDYLVLPSTSQILNVAVLNAEEVFSFLSNKFSFPGSNLDEVSGVEVDLVIRFWSWVVRWSKQKSFFQGIKAVSNLYLLPTAQETLRKLSSGIVSFVNTDSSAIDAWSILGVSPLHPNIPAIVSSSLQAASYLHIPRSSSYIVFLIRNCNPTPPEVSVEARLAAFKTIRTSLYDGWPRNMKINLSTPDKGKLGSLPIFKVRTQLGATPSLGVVFGCRIYVDITDHFPLPHLQKSEIYVDWSDFVTRCFASALDSGSPQINKDLDLIQFAVDNWAIQPAEVQDLFIDQAFQNWHRLPLKLRSDLTSLPFVIVNDTLTRKPPKDLIHPTSALKDLYIGEAGRMPAGRFAEKHYLATFQSLEFLRSTLDGFVIEDRLQYFSRSSSGDPHLRQKAIAFVQVLDRHWKGAHSCVIAKYRKLHWLPAARSTDLVSPTQCRDSRRDLHSHPYYYDLTLSVFEGEVYSAGLRSALGWSDIVPSDVLVNQFQMTLKLAPSFDRNERLVELLSYFDQLRRDGHLPNNAIELLRDVTSGQSWVPISSLSSGRTVRVNHALLSDCRLREPFRAVDNRLKENLFLQVLGCTSRPSFDILMEEFNQIQLTSKVGLSAALAILDEIAAHHVSNREYIRIPGEDCRAYPLDAVYFRDMRFISPSVAISGMVSAHNMISKAFAEVLGIQMLSSLTLGDDEDDEEQMFEDLLGRIRGFLRDYDPQYALNEFLANADDAGARQFHMYLNRRTWRAAENVISPGFQSALASPSLVLFNDAKMSDQDFSGLRRVGQGAKLALSDTHGRHGLGALSMYYFTDVVTVISGEFVMILDPSGNYLPPRRNNGKRTALKRKIAEIVSMYPDQLKPYEIFGISASSPTYDGTIFGLPLNSTISESACDYSVTHHLILDNYRKLAQQAFFFTRLERIRAVELIPEQHLLWDTSARRLTVNRLGEHFNWCNMYIKLDATSGSEDTWLITTSEVLDIPSEHQETAKGLKLTPHSKMKVQLAISREKLKNKSLETYPFSTMALPNSTSLPFHMNARFAISSNRQGIVLNSADSRSQKDAKTSFNTWILETAVPPLYLASLEHLIHGENLQNHSFSDARWWLLKCSDDIAKVSRDGFFKALAEGDHRIFKSADGQWVSFRDSVFSKEEPREVKGILDAIHAPKFVQLHRHTDISSVPTARIVDASFVKETLLLQTSLSSLQQILSNQTNLNEGISAVLRQTFSSSFLPNETNIKEGIFFSVLHYIRGESPLAGLPLLILSSGNLIEIPSTTQTSVHISNNKSHFTLFPSSSFVQIGYSSEVLDCLTNDNSVNMVAFTGETVLTLIERELNRFTGEQKIKWVHQFWRLYSTLPGPPSLESLESSGLSLIEGASGVISLRDCQPANLVYDSSLSISWPWIILILQQMGIEVVKAGENHVLRQFLSQRFPEPLENILKCIVHKGIATFEVLPMEQRSRLATWIRDQLSGKVSSTSWRQAPPVTRQDLLNLPIWEVHFNNVSQLHPASGLQVLPSHFSIQHIIPYLRPNTAIAASSLSLAQFMSFCMDTRFSNFRYMTCQQILDAIILPPRIIQNPQVREMRAFVQAMLGFAESDLRYITFMIPDRDGVLRPIGELYDDTVDLFAQTLNRPGNSPFVHQQFRDFVRRLRELGLVHEVTVATFRICASAIEEAFSGGTSVQSLREMCTTAFGVYQSQLPRLIMLNAGSWAALESIAFILRKVERRQGASYDVDRYFDQPLPLVMPPSRFVRPDLESVAWTQRALFFSEPSDELLTVNPKLGMPEVSEVVAHLIILTTRIARDHARDRVLLSDIKATYKWLNEHYEEARIHLLAAENEKIFLNVTDPEHQSWDGQWVAAKELVINLHYDTKSIKYVRDFLESYENLLLAAGCGTLKTLKREQAITDAGSESGLLREMRVQFNEMRKTEELTDVVLVPKKAREPLDGGVGENDEGDTLEVEDENIDKSQLRAHRVILAAAIPHLRVVQDWPRVVETGEIMFLGGTPFGAKCVLGK